MPDEFVAEVSLRNKRRVYRSGDEYRVVQFDRHGGENVQPIPADVVSAVADELRGRDVVVEDVAALLESLAAPLGLPFDYGHKLHFFAQDVLIVLVALGDTELSLQGRRYVYHIGG